MWGDEGSALPTLLLMGHSGGLRAPDPVMRWTPAAALSVPGQCSSIGRYRGNVLKTEGHGGGGKTRTTQSAMLREAAPTRRLPAGH